MAVTVTKQAEAYLEALAKALEIPPARYEQSESGFIAMNPASKTMAPTSSCRGLFASAQSSSLKPMEKNTMWIVPAL